MTKQEQENNKYSWEHPYYNKEQDKTEPNKSFEAFNYYIEMGSNRNLKAVAEHTKISYDTIKKYSAVFKWKQRIKDKLTHEQKEIYKNQMNNVIYFNDLRLKRINLLNNVLIKMLVNINTISNNEIEHITADQIKVFKQYIQMYKELEQIEQKNNKQYIKTTENLLLNNDFENQQEYNNILEHMEQEYTTINKQIEHELTTTKQIDIPKLIKNTKKPKSRNQYPDVLDIKDVKEMLGTY